MKSILFPEFAAKHFPLTPPPWWITCPSWKFKLICAAIMATIVAAGAPWLFFLERPQKYNHPQPPAETPIDLTVGQWSSNPLGVALPRGDFRPQALEKVRSFPTVITHLEEPRVILSF